MTSPKPAVVLAALGVCSFVRWRVRSQQVAPVDHRIPVALVNDLDLAQHLRIFHGINLPAGPALARIHAKAHEQAGYGRRAHAVPHFHSAEVSAALQAAEDAERAEADAFRRALVGLPPD